MQQILSFLCLFLLFVSSIIGCNASHTEPVPPKREFRAVWVATFHNIDWPTTKGMNAEAQKQEFLQLLKRQKANGMNAIVVQIRPSGDALYKSRLAPWSEYISGMQGKRPNYDPLAFMIKAAHDHNMELHAWMNPFRAISHVRFSSVASYNVAKRRPDWTFQYGERVYFDPGVPEVRDYLTSVIAEVVANYDVDGIHFDDYFYPYPESEKPLNDQGTYFRYGRNFPNIHEWRRHNIDSFIKSVSDTIRTIKPFVKFGISPIGLWRNYKQDARGTRVRSTFSSYDVLYADVRQWLQKGWIDYVAPQLYFNIQHPTADYAVLMPWWAKNCFGRHVYVGHAMFKAKEAKSNPWRDPTQLPRQLKLNQNYPQVKGSIFYSAKSFTNNPHGIEYILRRERYRFPALVPGMQWKDSIPPLAPQRLSIRLLSESAAFLTWDEPEEAQDGEKATYYVVYRFSRNARIDLKDPSQILTTCRETQFVDRTRIPGIKYTYVVTSVDRLHNESRSVAAAFTPVNAPKTVKK